ncbi:hypothetical protein [Streptomyces sp. NPDC048606]|uniref:hypothetical protein n=1 Tax=Streptomyces sp. NPDC048606 TaxID=3154726 RepID=UPI00343D8924
MRVEAARQGQRRQTAVERGRVEGRRERELQQLRAAYQRDEKERLREEQEQRAAVTRRLWAREGIRATERLARTDHTRQALVRHSARLPGIREAIAHLAREHRVPVTIGSSVGDSRYAAGVPLVAPDGSLLGIYDPLPQFPHDCGFLRDVGARMLFPSRARRERLVHLLKEGPPLLDYWTTVVRPGSRR